MLKGKAWFGGSILLALAACGTGEGEEISPNPAQQEVVDTNGEGDPGQSGDPDPSNGAGQAEDVGQADDGGQQAEGADGNQGGSALIEQFNPETHARLWMKVVHDDDGTPVVGCPVWLQWTRQGESVGRITSQTDEKGMARFPVEARVFVNSLNAMATPTSAPASVQIAQIMQPGDKDPIEMRVKRPAVFKGRVIDEDGHAVPGASIKIWAQQRWAVESMGGKEPTVTGTADANGNFGVSGMPGGPFLLSANADGMFAVQRATGFNGNGETLENIEIIMARSAMVRGEVLDENNQGVGSAMIEVGEAKRRVKHTKTEDPRLVYIPPRQWVLRTEPDGGFVIPAMPAGRTWNARIRHDDFLESFTKLEADLGVARFYLDRGLELHLRVTDTDGSALASGEAVLLTKNPRWQDVQGGNAAILGLVDDPDAILMVHATGKAIKTIWPVQLNTADQPLEIMLEPANPIVGKVMDGAGNAIANVRIQVKGLDLFEPDLMVAYPGQLPEKVFEFDQRVSDESGEFRIPGLYPGRFELTAIAPDGRELKQTVQGGTLDLTLVFE
jgi:hypothetical protein